MRVFVTGGSGFIGGRLVRQLIADGHEVVCMSRSGTTSARLHDLGVEVISGDLTDPEAVQGCIREAQPSHVAHLAAEIASHRSSERIEQVNVEGTRGLVQACRELPDLKCFLFLSSVVRGHAAGERLAEDDSIPAHTAYGKSKERGDQVVLGARDEWDLPAVILRPSHVYGPGGWLEQCLAERAFRIPGRGDNLWDVVHVDDVVSACTLLLHEAPIGEVFHVVDDDPVTMNEFFDRVARASGRKPFKHAPLWLVRLLRGPGPVAAATRSARSTNEKLKALGWKPRYPSSADGIPAVIRDLDDTRDSEVLDSASR